MRRWPGAQAVPARKARRSRAPAGAALPALSTTIVEGEGIDVMTVDRAAIGHAGELLAGGGGGRQVGPGLLHRGEAAGGRHPQRRTVERV